MLLPWTKNPQTNNPSACYHSYQQIQCQMHTGYGCARPISSHFRFILNDLSVFVSVCVWQGVKEDGASQDLII